MARVGWIGLGAMGAPMAANLVAAGHSVTVWNRTAARAAPLAAAGAAVAASPAGAVGDVTFSMLADDAALGDALLGPNGAVAALPEGAVLVEMSTVSPEASAEVGAATAARGALYLCAPVSGSVAFARSAKLTVLASGPREGFDRVEPILAALSARRIWLGPGGEARVMKLALNLMVGVSAAMLGEALALGAAHGLDRRAMLDVINASAVASPLLGYKADMVAARDYAPAFAARLMAKDFSLIRDAAGGLRLPIATRAGETFEALVARGEGDADFFKAVELAGVES